MLKAKHKTNMRESICPNNNNKKGTTYVIPFIWALEDSLAS